MFRAYTLARAIVGASMAVLAAASARPVLAEMPARLTIVDGSGAVISDGVRHAAVPGLRVGPCDIISADARSMIQIESGDGVRVGIGPGSKLLMQAAGSGDATTTAARHFLLDGWVKVTVAPGRGQRPQRVDTRFAGLLVNSGVAVMNAGRERARLFAEQGEVTALDSSGSATGRRRIDAGRLFVRGSEGGRLTHRATAAFLSDMPAVFRDTVPSRLAQVALLDAPPRGGTEARLAELLDWFGARSSLPACVSPWLIRAVQRALETRGLSVGPVDGVFGLQTQAALRQFQAGHGLAVSGQPDAATVARLGRDEETAGR